MRIENPEWVWLFFGLIPLFLFLVWETRQRATILPLFGGMVDRTFIRHVMVRAMLLIVLFSLLLLSLVNPQIIREKHYVQRESDAQILALFDVSKSMAARPNPGLPNRLMRSKELFLGLLPRLDESEVAVFAFTDVVLSHVSFTTNHELIRETVEQAVVIESTPIPGSDLVKALERISRKFDPTKDQKFLIVFTDGIMTRGGDTVRKALQDMRQANITIVIVGVGEKEGVSIPVFDTSGRFTGLYVLSKETGRPYVSSIDEENLKRLVRAGDGTYFSEKDGSGIHEFFSSRLTTIPRESEIASEELIDLYPFLTAAAFVSFIALLKWYQ